MPIIVRARSDEHPGDVIKKFKKISVATDIVQKVKDRRYYMKPSEIKTQRLNELRRTKKRLRAIKKMKNPPTPRPPRKIKRFPRSSDDME